MILPVIQTTMPNPSSSDCETLLEYTNAVIWGLETVLNKLYEVSASPDETMILIRDMVETMLSEAKTMQSNLGAIKAEANNKMNFFGQSEALA